MGSIALCTFETGYEEDKYELHEIIETNDKTYPYNKKDYPSLGGLPKNARCFILIRENDKDNYVAIIVGLPSKLIHYNGKPADLVFCKNTVYSYVVYEENISSHMDEHSIMCAVDLLSTNFKILS